MSEQTLSVDGLTIHYSHATGATVSDVSLRLTPGEIAGLVGESGCGKSTTAMACAGYIPANARVTSGSVRLGDRSLLELSARSLRKVWGGGVSYIAQNAATSLNPALLISTHFAEVLRHHGGLSRSSARRRTIELLTEVDVPDPQRALDRRAHEFSGGQQQRIALALALAADPSVLILDEPTAGLDTSTQRRIIDLIRREVLRRHLSALFVTHDLALLSEVADTVAVMYAGQVVERGTADAVLSAPDHPYTRALVAAVPRADRPSRPVGLDGAPPPSVVSDRCAFEERCAHRTPTCTAGPIALRTLTNGHEVRCIRHPLPTPSMDPRPGRVRGEGRSRPPVLQASALTCWYRTPHGAVKVVDDVDLDVGAEEIVALVGESGSGKSTLLRSVAGIHREADGALLFHGVQLPFGAQDRSRALRGAVQLVFQDPHASLNPRRTVLDIVRRPVRLFRPDVARSDEPDVVAELLANVRLSPNLLHRYPHELSGGQRQRVALARAFASEPTLLLCDEVTSALDVSVQAGVIDTLLELARSCGTAVIFVSHDLALVRSFADRVVVMQRGVVCESGATAQIFDQPAHDYTKLLLSSLPQLIPVALPASRPRARSVDAEGGDRA